MRHCCIYLLNNYGQRVQVINVSVWTMMTSNNHGLVRCMGSLVKQHFFIVLIAQKYSGKVDLCGAFRWSCKSVPRLNTTRFNSSTFWEWISYIMAMARMKLNNIMVIIVYNWLPHVLEALHGIKGSGVSQSKMDPRPWKLITKSVQK